MNFTDTEVGMSMAHQRQMRTFRRDVQGLIDEMDDDIVSLRGRLKAALADLDTERAGRQSLQFEVDRLNRLLDVPLD